MCVCVCLCVRAVSATVLPILAAHKCHAARLAPAVRQTFQFRRSFDPSWRSASATPAMPDMPTPYSNHCDYGQCQALCCVAGDINMESEGICQIAKMDVSREIGLLDSLSGVAAVLSQFQFESSEFWQEQKTSLTSLAGCLPVLSAVMQCKQLYSKYKAKSDANESSHDVAEARWNFLIAFTAASKEAASFKKKYATDEAIKSLGFESQASRHTIGEHVFFVIVSSSFLLLRPGLPSPP